MFTFDLLADPRPAAESLLFKVIVAALIVGGCLAGLYSTYEFYHHIGWGAARSSLVMGEEAINPNIFATRLLLPLALSVGAFFRFASAC